MFYLIKKLLDVKRREYKLKRIKQEPMKLIKYHYLALIIKDMYQMMKFILWLIFIKIVIIKKNYDHRDIVITEKDCDNGKLL